MLVVGNNHLPKKLSVVVNFDIGVDENNNTQGFLISVIVEIGVTSDF